MDGKRSNRSVSIGTKILMSHLALCLIVILLSGVLISILTSQYMREYRIDELMGEADSIAEIARDIALNNDTPKRRMVHMLEKLIDAKVFFVSEDDEHIRVGSDRLRNGAGEDGGDPEGALDWFELMDTIDREYAGRVLAGERVSAMQRFEFAQEEIIFVGVPIQAEDGTARGGVILAQPVAQLHRLFRMIHFMLTIVMGVSLLLAVILAMELTRVLVRPVKRITLAARQMEDGVYAEPIADLPGNEIGELGRALNSLSERLVDVIGNLRNERHKLRLVISGIGEGLVAVDTQWNIINANTAFLVLAELDNASRLLTDEGRARFGALLGLLETCMRTGEPGQVEWENDSRRAILTRATALKDEGGEILGAVCLSRDVSEEQRLEQLRRDYVANVSHELRTPLTGIRGMVEPLIDGCMETEEERQDSYRIILKETVRLEKLVGEMLDMSRLQDGRLKVDLEPMELPGILDAAVRNMKPIADDSGVLLSVETDGSPLACLGNEDRITQVLVILIDNALSFTPRGGSVVVFARDGDPYVCVGVRDTGCGIEPKDLPMIWERFYKADKSRMRTTGTGLGLSIAKLVTQLMGGDITVKSEPGAGAEFTFTLKKWPEGQ